MIGQNAQVHYVPKRRSEVGGYDGGGGGGDGGGGGWSEEKRDDREESITSWADETEMELERQMKSMELEKEQHQGGGGRGVSGANNNRGGRGRGARGRGWNSFSHGEHDDRIAGPEDGDSEYVRFVHVLHCILIAFFMLTTGVYICLLPTILIKRFLILLQAKQ